MNEGALAALMDERFGQPPTPPPRQAPKPDTAEAIQQRQRVLDAIPGDECPGWEAT